jgi:hypothetical protein
MEYANVVTELAQASMAGRTLTGYASVFNYPIQGSGRHPQTTFVKPGAFTRTLDADPLPQVLLNHGQDPTVGQKPLGVPAVMRPDSRGLYVEVPLDHTSYNDDIIVSLGSGALRAMSIMFETKQESFSADRTERYIEQVQLFEFGPVTFPANDAATASLHSLTDYTQPPSDRGPERALYEAWLRKGAHRLEAEDDELAELAARMKRWEEM